jgi:hypothetical protein
MIAETYLRTNHHLASRLPSKESIAGKFNAGDNILTTRDPELHFRMDAKAAGFCPFSPEPLAKSVLLAWQSAFSIARVVLDGVSCMGESNGGECLPKKRVRTGDFVREVPEVPWGRARACGKGEGV